MHAWLEEIGSNPFQIKEQELNSYNVFKKVLLDSSTIDLYKMQMAFDFINARINKVPAEKRSVLSAATEKARNLWIELMKKFPVFYLRKENKHLKSAYKIDEIEKELNNALAVPNSLLHDFVKLLGISIEDFVFAAKTGSSPKQETLRRKINRLVDEKINTPFQDFYKTEKITLDIGFNAGVISFVVQSADGEALMLSERSNGLKWYIETFIDACANDVMGKNVVFLLDEPGISLHVNAQKELMKLFQHLAQKGNQVVYTTHSPYMLSMEAEGVHRIRAVVKDVGGYTYIYKTAYDSRIATDSQRDTLAPIISAIGMNLSDTFGPAKDKINLVTEGMSDYIYLCMMTKVLNFDTNKYVFIPSVGASNCVNIYAILCGWGCKSIAIFDYDKAGVESGGEIIGKKMLCTYQRDYCYLYDATEIEIAEKTYIKSKYMIEDVVTHEEIDKFCRLKGISNELGKPLIAKMMSDAVELGEFEVGNACRDNFEALFKRIERLCGEEG